MFALPANPLDVVIHADRQLAAAARAAAGQNFTPVSSSHALAKTVYTQASVDPRLISPFRHSTSFLSF
jgi:hypothetical protein